MNCKRCIQRFGLFLSESLTLLTQQSNRTVFLLIKIFLNVQKIIEMFNQNTVNALSPANNNAADVAPPPGGRWCSNHPHGRLLRSLIMTGAIPESMKPSQIQQIYPTFQSYNSHSFSQVVRRYRGPNNQNSPASAASPASKFDCYVILISSLCFVSNG